MQDINIAVCRPDVTAGVSPGQRRGECTGPGGYPWPLHVRPSLEAIAAELGISPATLKRKLKAHQCSYQLLSDQVRKQMALYLMSEQDFSAEQVARFLNFYDVSNFRRSFRRWLALP